MILSAQTIRSRYMIRPFRPRTVLNGKTFGLGSAGYDVRVEFKDNADSMFIQVGGFVLASTVEEFFMPDDVVGFVHDKSSWARRGLAVQNTVIEPGWRGFLTLELSNHSDGYIHIRSGDPIAQIVFHLLDEPTYIPYDGKYQDQPRGPQEAVEEV